MGHPLTSKICPVCGKKFIQAPLTVYRAIWRGKTYNCCCYTCYKTVLGWKENANREKKNSRK